MKTIHGVATSAIIFNTNTTEHSIDDYAIAQIQGLCNNTAFTDSKIRVMPDVHPGKVTTIGFTATLGPQVLPNVIGIDIGCGMTLAQIKGKVREFQKLDTVIRERVPSGFSIRKAMHHKAADFDLSQLRCFSHIQENKALLSLGTLGGGNHFIELDQDDAKNAYLIIHSGSRHLGKQVCEYYQEEGFRALCGSARFQIDQLIKEMKAQGNSKEIHNTLKALRKKRAEATPVARDLAYVEGELFEDYIHDMRIVQHFAVLNRKAMTDVIINGMGLSPAEEFTTIHNYIDMDTMILRKGSVSAKAGEKLLIPINMRDGSLICIGKGNEDWNFSAPHGAGRLMSRRAAFDSLSMEEYKEEMAGIYSTCIVKDTLDESPMAYKSMDEIVSQIGPTAEIIERIRPVYNFKAAE